MREMAAGDCTVPGWSGDIGPYFGLNDMMVQWQRRLASCEGLEKYNQRQLALTLFVAGETDEAVDILNASLEKNTSINSEFFRVQILLKAGRYREARQGLGRVPVDHHKRFVMAAAINRMNPEGKRIPIDDTAVPDLPDVARFSLAGWRGECDVVNDIAARIDARRGGSFALLMGISDCLCGAPFDLDVPPVSSASSPKPSSLGHPPTRSA